MAGRVSLNGCMRRVQHSRTNRKRKRLTQKANLEKPMKKSKLGVETLSLFKGQTKEERSLTNAFSLAMAGAGLALSLALNEGLWIAYTGLLFFVIAYTVYLYATGKQNTFYSRQEFIHWVERYNHMSPQLEPGFSVRVISLEQSITRTMLFDAVLAAPLLASIWVSSILAVPSVIVVVAFTLWAICMSVLVASKDISLNMFEHWEGFVHWAYEDGQIFTDADKVNARK